MKLNILAFRFSKLFALFIVLIFGACQNKENKPAMNADKVVCFQAIDGVDTAYLEIDTTFSSAIIGKLKFHYGDSTKYVGDFAGEIAQDTLKGFFNFQPNGGEQWYRNPVAFLKKGSDWIMGEGEFILIWGSGYFDPKVPIDYSRSKFKFQPAVCH